ncbi:2-hydroxyacid dehydrogenase [Flavobacterium selenitireducens]|uniref:2-hydroxyacid dehydrogenase n=1 Tax=Flavobacterium selenitireducens TaxID=2722704 RepID=UPI00168A76CF|nr:D-glycerate dehydrogenase [Flavobacterium selenitireducens]MBD3581754.1 D-glycerate dehydrogenase [Flavobacterium selenitireducens]
MRVFITRQFPKSGLALFEKAGIEVEQWTENRDLTQEELIAKCKNADALLAAGRIELNAKFLETCQHLKVISLFSVGYDNVDMEKADELGIPVGHTPGVLSKATADTAFLLMQATARKAFHHHKRIAKGDWEFFDPLQDLGQELQGKTLGIFGLGNIGYEMAKSSKGAFDMEILYHNRSANEKAESELGAKKVPFDELLENSDVISVHANLSEETEGVFDADAFAKMKPTAIFVNIARGPIHRQSDLKKALESGEIWGAGLDVTDPEPMDKDDELLDFPNVCVLPHIGSSTFETRNAMAELSARNAIAGLRNEPLPARVKPD